MDRQYPYPCACTYAGFALAELGDFEKADISLRKGIDGATETGHPFALGLAETLYGGCYLLIGDGRLAIEHLKKSLEHCEQSGWAILSMYNWAYLGWAYHLLGELATADELIARATEMQAQIGAESGLAHIYYEWSQVHFDLGNGRKALDLAEEALRLAEKNGEKGNEGGARVGWGRIVGHLDPSRRGEGESSIRQGIDIWQKLEVKTWYPFGYLCLGELYAEAGEREKALENLTIAEANYRELGMDWGLASVYAAYGELWKREGDAAKARESYRTAIEIFRECGADGWVKKYEVELAQLP
jgi:tetratricopeptide (TPR) repeat protein